MNEKEKSMVADRESKMTLGDHLLEKEFKRNKAAKDILAKHNLDKSKSNQPKILAILPVIDKWVNYQAFMTQIPGISIGIRHHDKVLLNKQFGLADLGTKEKLAPHHLFCCGSHSKMFTTTAIMQLHQAQKINIHEKVNRYLPWFQSPVDPVLDEITIYHLLTHTAGIITDARLANGYPPGVLKEVKQIVQKGISTSELGKTIKYSNFGYCILGCIVETISGLSYEKYVIENILQPLDMKYSAMALKTSINDQLAIGYTTWYPDRTREKVPKMTFKSLDHLYITVGGLVSNAEDLMKFWGAHFVGNELLLSDAVKAEMHKTPVQVDNQLRGIGFEITKIPGGKEFWQIIGGTFGYRTQSGFVSQDNLAVVVLTTTTDSPVTQISTSIINLVNAIQNRWDEFQESSTDPNNPPNYHEFEGLVECPYGIYCFAQIREKLVIFDMDSKDPASNFIILEACSENKFISTVPLFFAKENEPIEFKPDETGKMTLHDSLGRKVSWFSFDSYCRL